LAFGAAEVIQSFLLSLALLASYQMAIILDDITY